MDSFVRHELFLKLRIPILILLVGLILIGGGIFYFKSGLNFSGTKVEVLSASTEKNNQGSITAEISGEVINPGVYKMENGSRVDDLMTLSGGLSANADREWTNKYLNRAAKITDGQKVYIPSVNQQSSITSANNSGVDQTVSSTFSSDSNSIININTASLKELDSLPGIGQIYGQSIIEHRPYSTIEELVSKGSIKQSLLEKIKDKISVY